MRKLMWFTLGFALACALCAYMLPVAMLAGAVAGALLLAMLCFRASRRAALALLGCAVGFLWFSMYHSHYLSAAAALDGMTKDISVRITDYSRETSYGIAADGSLDIGGKTYQVCIYLDEREPLEPGNMVTGSFRFRLSGDYQQGKGVFLTAYQSEEVPVSEGEQTLRDYPAKLRRQIRMILENCFPEDTVAFAKALLLGDTSGLSYETDTDLKISGIRHVVAVSGLHVSILFALLSNVTFRKRYLMAILGCPLLFLFAAVAGFTPSVTRACIMSALMLLAQLFYKQYDGASALSFAALVMMIANPLVITSVGFQLSVASVAGIFLFEPGISKWMLSVLGKGKIRNWFIASVSVTLSAMTLTTPLCAYYFGMVSLIGVVTNLLTLWVISVVFYGLIAVCLVSIVWMKAAQIMGKLVSISIRYVLFVAGKLADFPLAAVYTQSVYITAWLVFVYVLLLIFLVSRRRKPAVLSCCTMLGLCLALVASWAEPLMDEVRLTVLDVGQGQCLLFQSEGRTYMVDCGGEDDGEAADTAAETLLSQGISKLDGLILTHFDRDHAGGAGNLLSRIDTDLLILPPLANELSQKTEGEVVYASKDLTISFGDTVINIFASTFPGTGNETSLCILFDTKKCDILVTGDRDAFGERSLLRNAAIPEVDVLIAGHHGSKNSTCEELLQVTRPELVLISVGADNSYGHPAAETLERLENYGCTVYRTDKNGTIILRR